MANIFYGLSILAAIVGLITMDIVPVLVAFSLTFIGTQIERI